jgi:hypothetical protein
MSPLLLLVLQQPTTPATPVDLRQAPVVAETNRIRLTPRIDGKIEEEEWDALGTSGETKTYLQWEPGVLHIAASGAMGKDLLVSIDPGSDGWLVGKNNLEARIGLRDGKPTIKLRILDATNVSGPTYREIDNLEAPSKVAIGEDGTIEVSIVDPGLDLLPEKGGKLSARIDVVASDTPALLANEPRSLTQLDLQTFRAAALPAGLKAKADFTDVPVVPGGDLNLRFGFTGDAMPKRIAMRSEGFAKDVSSAFEIPFPTNGKKGVNVEYKTKIQSEALPGYRIARASITGADGIPAILQASFRIAPPLDIELKDTHLKISDKDRSIKVGFQARGNSRRRLAADAVISAPTPYRILNGDDTQKILLAEPRLPLSKSFGLFIPTGSKGTVPVTFTMTIGKNKVEVVKYITID